MVYQQPIHIPIVVLLLLGIRATRGFLLVLAGGTPSTTILRWRRHG